MAAPRPARFGPILERRTGTVDSKESLDGAAVKADHARAIALIERQKVRLPRGFSGQPIK